MKGDRPQIIPALSGLRGFAALLVLFSHAEKVLFPSYLGHSAGHMGVMLFFTLSAFLITHLYLNSPANKVSIRNYAVARFARVYPLFFFMLMTGAVAYFFLPDYPYAARPLKVAAVASLQFKFHVFWTIKTEAQFYVLFALIWWLGWRIERPTLVAFIFAALACLCVFIDIYPFPSGNINKTIQFFGIGVLAALIRPILIQKSGKLADVFFGMAFIAFCLSVPSIFELVTGAEQKGFWSPWLLLLSGLIILFGSIANGAFSRLFSSRIAIWLGDISFGVYLIHHPVLFFVTKHFGFLPNWVEMLMVIVFTLIASQLAFVLLERPALKAIRSKLTVSAKS